MQEIRNICIPKVLLLYICFFIHFEACAKQITQRRKIDSLQSRLLASNNDTEKINILLKLSASLDCKDSLQKISYAKRALAEAERSQWTKGICNSYKRLGDAYEYCTSDFIKAINVYEKLEEIAKTNYDKTMEADAFLEIAFLYQNTGHFERALYYYNKIIALGLGNDVTIGTWANIGEIYKGMGDFNKALKSYEESLKLLGKIVHGDKNTTNKYILTQSGLLLKTAEIFIVMGDINKAINNYENVLKNTQQEHNDAVEYDANKGLGKCYLLKRDFKKCIPYFEQALQIIRKPNVTGFSGYEEDILNEMANAHLQQGDKEHALSRAQQSLQIAIKNNNKPQQARTFATLGNIYNSKKEYKTAVQFLKEAQTIARKTGAKDDEKTAWEGLSESYSGLKQTDKAFEAYKNYITLRDSVYSADKAKELTRTEMQGEFDRQQLQDSLAQAKKDVAVRIEIQRQRLFTYGGFAGLALVLLLSFFIYRNYNNAKKSNIIIKEEKENAEAQRLRAEHSEQFKQQFLANMSHEIRTPMNAVSGMTDLLLDKNPRPDQLNYLQVISKSSDILLHIINDILDLSKIEAGKLELEQIDFSLADTIEQVKETLSIKSEEKGLQLLTHIDNNIADVLLGDPFRLNQILINLGGNAIKFTEKGSVEINVKKVAEDDENVKLQFAVHDTGSGIPADKLDHLFENFKQVNTSDSRKYGGTGLGLSISKQLVELQGGNISVESKVGSGTTFSFIISFSKGSVQRLNDRIHSERKVDGTALNGLHILLADDNEYNRLVAYEALHLKADVIIDEVVNGEEAIKKLMHNDYDVILMDVQMPVMNGWDASRYIRDELAAPKNQIPIIALTASMLRNDLDKCTQAGMNTYVPKPFKIGQLITAIAELTGRKLSPPKNDQASIPIANSGVTDLNYLYKFCEGEEERMKKYIQLYLKAVPAFKEKISAAADKNDMAEMALQLHSFKPKWMMMGMKGINELGTKMEQLCREDNIEALQYVPRLIEQTERSVEELKDKC